MSESLVLRGPSTAPSQAGEHLLEGSARRNGSPLPSPPDGSALQRVGDDDGAITVSLVPLRGDLNYDAHVDVADLPMLIDAIFNEPAAPEADTNSDASVGAPDIPGLLQLLAGEGILQRYNRTPIHRHCRAS